MEIEIDINLCAAEASSKSRRQVNHAMIFV